MKSLHATKGSALARAIAWARACRADGFVFVRMAKVIDDETGEVALSLNPLDPASYHMRKAASSAFDDTEAFIAALIHSGSGPDTPAAAMLEAA